MDMKESIARNDERWKQHSGEMSRLYLTLDRLAQGVADLDRRMTGLGVKMAVITGVLVAAGQFIAQALIK